MTNYIISKYLMFTLRFGLQLTRPRIAWNLLAYYAYAMVTHTLPTAHKSFALTLTLLCICLGQVPYPDRQSCICYLLVTWCATWLGLGLGLLGPRTRSHLVCRLVEQWARSFFFDARKYPFGRYCVSSQLI